MPSTAFDAWVEVFDEEISNIWRNEPEELKSCSMLIIACRRELKKIGESIDLELDIIRRKLKRKDQLQTRLKLFTSPNQKKLIASPNKENIEVGFIENTSAEDNSDIFDDLNETSELNNSSFLKSSDEDRQLESNIIMTSPTIKKKKRSYYQKVKNKELTALKNAVDNTPVNLLKLTDTTHEKQNDNVIFSNEDMFKQNVFKTPIKSKFNVTLDSSVIDNTPEISRKKLSSGVPPFKKKRRNTSKNPTLTQMFSKSERRKMKGSNNEEYDSDATFLSSNIESTKSKLGITEMINLINESNQDDASPVLLGSHSKGKNDQNVEQTSIEQGIHSQWSENLNNLIKNGEEAINQELEDLDLTLLPPKELNVFLAKANKVPEHQLEPEEVVRGNARKNLPGWACKDCEKFYMNQDLTPNELVEKMNKCSKHRSKYKPREETIPGFWDLTMPTQD